MRPATEKRSSERSCGGAGGVPLGGGGAEGSGADGFAPAKRSAISRAVCFATNPLAYGFRPSARSSATFFSRSAMSSLSSAMDPRVSGRLELVRLGGGGGHVVGDRRVVARQLQQVGDHEGVQIAVEHVVDV